MTLDKDLTTLFCGNCGLTNEADLKVVFYKITEKYSGNSEWKFQVQGYCSNCKKWITHLKQTDSVMVQVMCTAIIKNTEEGYDMKEAFKESNQEPMI